ncbi:MAG: hypothetical protein QN720_06470, partial [Nitrososphaeraceae archaeon]|nr:hypothetical protein [Nitrososphaeraceae archaeon]
LGIDEAHAAEIGLRLYKVGMPWPLEPNGIREFAQGLEEILVVEEKRQVIEDQMKNDCMPTESSFQAASNCLTPVLLFLERGRSIIGNGRK